MVAPELSEIITRSVVEVLPVMKPESEYFVLKAVRELYGDLVGTQMILLYARQLSMKEYYQEINLDGSKLSMIIDVIIFSVLQKME